MIKNETLQPVQLLRTSSLGKSEFIAIRTTIQYIVAVRDNSENENLLTTELPTNFIYSSPSTSLKYSVLENISFPGTRSDL
jgi:hypothetical protein